MSPGAQEKQHGVGETQTRKKANPVLSRVQRSSGLWVFLTLSAEAVVRQVPCTWLQMQTVAFQGTLQPILGNRNSLWDHQAWVLGTALEEQLSAVKVIHLSALFQHRTCYQNPCFPKALSFLSSWASSQMCCQSRLYPDLEAPTHPSCICCFSPGNLDFHILETWGKRSLMNLQITFAPWSLAMRPMTATGSMVSIGARVPLITMN